MGSQSEADIIEGLKNTIGICRAPPAILALLSNSSAIRFVYAYESEKPLIKPAPYFFNLSGVKAWILS